MNDRRLRRPSAPRSVYVGDIKVSYVPDGALLLKPVGPLVVTAPAAAQDEDASRAYRNDTGHLVANTGGLLVEHGTEALLIDAGFGPRSVPAAHGRTEPGIAAAHGGSLPANLARLGRHPDDVTTIAVTRLRLENLGWLNAQPPLFTRASVVVPKAVWENRHSTSDLLPEETAALESRLRLVAEDEEIFPGVHVVALPGHTGFSITSKDSRLLAFGTALHSPLQIGHPDWTVFAEPDAPPPPAGHAHLPGPADAKSASLAAEHRRRLIAELRRPNTLGFGIYFADVVFGRVRRDSHGLTWHPQ